MYIIYNIYYKIYNIYCNIIYMYSWNLFTATSMWARRCLRTKQIIKLNAGAVGGVSKHMMYIVEQT